MSAYMISQVTVTNREKFKEYLAATRDVASKYGAKIVARGEQRHILNGDGNEHQMVFVVEFPSIENLEEWNSSEEYQSLVPLRDAGSRQYMVAYDEVPLLQT